ncbi:MAG TPA: zf-HC2 domain-containing protein [Candidatus Eisenbacteria bacterium]|nr:zf-HC2 domain-containing protein [Candidatus Eisenbacteria bacterium]
MRCHTAQRLVIAGYDGELASWRRRALDRHLATCERCRAERASTDRVLAAIDTLAVETPMPARLEQNVLRDVRKLAAEEEQGSAFAWLRSGVPIVATGAVALLAVVIVRGMDEPAGPTSTTRRDTVAQAPPSTRLVARKARRVPDEPPPALAARPDLFMDLPILRNMEKLQHFDAIATTDTDDGGTPDAGGTPSNG